MPVYDEHLGRVVVRVVYDGPGMAGKTTNVRKLSRIFSSSRSSELDTYGETAGRTTYFDWFSMDSGLVHGYPLRTEFVTVPGQRVLARRRLALVEHADALIFVVDASPGRLSDSRQMFFVLREHLERVGRKDVPLIVQVNKQDISGAAPVEVVRRSFELDDRSHILAARAHQDVGVRESAVLAIRAAANRAQKLIVEDGVSSIRGACGTPETLRAHLEEVESRIRLRPIEILRQQTAVSETVRSAEPQPEDEPAPDRSACDELVPTPPFPKVQQEPGGVWPPVGGREVVGRLNLEVAVLVPERSQASGSADKARWTYWVGEHVLCARGDAAAVGLEKARKLLVQEVRRHLLLGSLLPESTVLSLQADDEGCYFLWRIACDMVPLDEALQHGLAASDESQVRTILLAVVQLLTRTCRLAVEQGVLIVPSLSLFGFERGHLKYFGDDIKVDCEVRSWALRLRESVDWVVSALRVRPDLRGFFTGAIGQALVTELTEDEREALGVSEVFAGLCDRDHFASFAT